MILIVVGEFKMKNIIPQNSVWIMYSSENCDPYFSKFITDKTIVPALSILSGEKNVLISHSLDFENIKNFQGEILMYDGENSLLEKMNNTLKDLNFPSTVYLNFSDKMDSQIDVIGYGTYRFLTDNITRFYFQNNKPSPAFKSSDVLIYTLLDTKTEEDIFYLSLAARRASEILKLSFSRIKVGMTEKQIMMTVQNIFKFKPSYFTKYGIVKEEFSWEKELCPIVLVGPNIKKGGHTGPSDKILRPGYTVYMDFGVKIHLKNGKKYSSDLQRMGYVLKQRETNPPENVQKIFDTLYSSITKGIKNSKPGVKGFEIDQIVRDSIINSGYPNYNHATGHPVGELAHSPGTSLSPKGHKRSSLNLQKNGVYTIEPRIQIENGGSIEEMVLVTENGGKTLCPRQDKIYLIR